VPHVDTPLPEHSVSPETHTPVQTPATHVELAHAVGAAHMPSAPHVSTPLPEHWSAPGVQDPVHAPAAQTPMHASATLHAPLALHVCTPLPMHCVAPAAHAPAHTPLTHVWFPHGLDALHAPAELQV
jgi:hypothetical protein